MNTSLSEFDQLYNLHKGMSYCRFCFISVGKSVDAATHKKQQKHSIIQRRKDKDFFFLSQFGLLLGIIGHTRKQQSALIKDFVPLQLLSFLRRSIHFGFPLMDSKKRAEM